MAQKWNRSKGDWIYQLEQDKKDLKLDLSDTEIGCYSKDQFSRIVKQKTDEFAARQLEKVRDNHSKTENLKFEGFKPAKYFFSKNLTTQEVQTLFKLRTRMVNVKGNYRSSNTNNMWYKV